MAQEPQDSVRAQVKSRLAAAAGEDLESTRGCCTITWDEGSETSEGVSREACRDAARDVGGTWEWHAGSC